MSDQPATSSQTRYRVMREQYVMLMIMELLKMMRMKKKELGYIKLPWFKWMLKNLQAHEIQISPEIKKMLGKPRKNELRYYKQKGK